MFCTKFNLSADLTVIASYNGLGIYLTSLSLTTCGIVHVPWTSSLYGLFDLIVYVPSTIFQL